MAKLRIGTCSWKYPSWKGLVYSAAKGINYLEEYARRYSTVEVDQWFWSLFDGSKAKLPRKEDVTAYRRSVPDNFRFSIKAPNSLTLTHHYKKRKTDPLFHNPHFLSRELWQDFMASIAPLKGNLGPVILQFEYLNKQKMDTQAHFLNRLEKFFNEVGSVAYLAVETRNPYYLNARFFDFLKHHQATPVLLHGYWMPPVTVIYHKWRKKILNHETVVIRLHGTDRNDIAKRTGNRWDKIVAPMDKELAGIANMVKELVEHDVNVFFNVNNHYEGSAPLTIEKFSGLLKSIN